MWILTFVTQYTNKIQLEKILSLDVKFSDLDPEWEVGTTGVIHPVPFRSGDPSPPGL